MTNSQQWQYDSIVISVLKTNTEMVWLKWLLRLHSYINQNKLYKLNWTLIMIL